MWHNSNGLTAKQPLQGLFASHHWEQQRQHPMVVNVGKRSGGAAGSASPESANHDWFGRVSATASLWLGSRWAFACAAAIILIWGVTGPLFHYSDSWQLVINTGTTIITFLMVFLIQNTQNRDARAINLKLDELIRAVAHAHDDMMSIENLSDAELDLLQARYEKAKAAGLAEEAAKKIKKIDKATNSGSMRR